ncbi:MAG: hypothetical protein AAF992_05300 [Bacteroidota bacterium]
MMAPMNRGFILLFLIIISSCGSTSEQRVDTTAVQEEMAQREPKRVMPEEITKAAYLMGEPLAQEMFTVLVEQYQQQAPDTDFMAYLQDQSMHTFAEDATVHWIPVSTQADELRKKEQQILEAYRYSQQQREELIGNVQRIGEDTLLYTHPVTLDKSLRTELNLPADTEETFLGMWSIYISKKAIVQAM